MKRYICLLLLLPALFLPGTGSGAQKFTLPEVKSSRLANGIKFLHVEDDLPQTTIVISVGLGRMHETEKNAGISDLLVRQMLVGGSLRYPGTSAFEKIENIGGRISISTSWESTTISVQVLSRFTAEAWDVAASFLESPSFKAEFFSRALEGVTGDLKMRYNDPFNTAFDFTRETIFRGQGYGALPTVKKTGAYTVDNLKSEFKKYFVGSNTIIAVSSSVPFRQCLKLTEKFMGPLPAGVKGVPAPLPSDIEKNLKDEKGRIYLLVKDLPQATVIAASSAPGIESESAYALTLMDYLLGGGSFSSKLMTEIRVKRGLAYMVQSVYRPRAGAGIFMALAQTKSESAAQVMELIQSSIDEFSAGEIPKEGITRAKEAITNSYVFKFDSRINLLANYINIEYYGLPADYYVTYTDRINSVTPDMISSETRVLTSDRLIRVVVGSRECLPGLEKLGKVIIIEGYPNAR